MIYTTMLSPTIYDYFSKEGPIIGIIIAMVLIILYLIALRQYTHDWRHKLGSIKDEPLYSSIKSPFLKSLSPKAQIQATESRNDTSGDKNSAKSKNPTLFKGYISKKHDLLTSDNCADNESDNQKSYKAFSSSGSDGVFDDDFLKTDSTQTAGYSESDQCYQYYDPLKNADFLNKIRQRRRRSVNLGKHDVGSKKYGNLSISANIESINTGKGAGSNSNSNSSTRADANVGTSSGEKSVFKKLLIIPILPLVAAYLVVRIFWDIYRIVVFISIDILLTSLTGAYSVYGLGLGKLKQSMVKLYNSAKLFASTTLSSAIVAFIENSALWLYNTGFPLLISAISSMWATSKSSYVWFANHGGPKLAQVLESTYFNVFLPAFNFIVSAYALISSVVLVLVSVGSIVLGKAALNSIWYWEKLVAGVSALGRLVNYITTTISVSLANFIGALTVNTAAMRDFLSKKAQELVGAVSTNFVIITETYIVPAVLKLTEILELQRVNLTAGFFKLVLKIASFRNQLVSGFDQTYLFFSSCTAWLQQTGKAFYFKAFDLYYQAKPVMLEAGKFAVTMAATIRVFTNKAALHLISAYETVVELSALLYANYLAGIFEWCGKHLLVFYKIRVLPALILLLIETQSALTLAQGMLKQLASMAGVYCRITYKETLALSVKMYIAIAEYTQHAWTSSQPVRKEIMDLAASLVVNAYLVMLDLAYSLVQYIYFFSKVVTAVSIKLVDDGNEAIRELIASTREQADRFVGTWSESLMQPYQNDPTKKRP